MLGRCVALLPQGSWTALLSCQGRGRGGGGGGLIPCFPKTFLTLSYKKCFVKLSLSQTFCIWLAANLIACWN